MPSIEVETARAAVVAPEDTGTGRLTLTDIAEGHARSRPDEMAAICQEHRITYAELNVRANRLAAWLLTQNVAPGDRILWLGQNCHRILEGILAAAKIGAVFCPANWRGSAEEYAFVLEDLQPTVVFWQETEVGDKVREARGSVAVNAVWVRHDTDEPGGYEDVLRSGSGDRAHGEADPDAPVLLLYTAAWEGKPNGALIPHRAIIAHNLIWAWLSDIDPAYCYLSFGPLFHVATMYPMMATFHMGGKNVFLSRADPREICETVDRERCNGAFIIEPTISTILALDDLEKYDLHSLKVWPTLNPEWVQIASPDTSLWGRGGATGYGQTECMGILTAAGLGGEGAHGRPVPGVHVRLLTPGGDEVGMDEVGEISARGLTVMVGYHNRPELNARRFENGWYRTGDLGRRESDGSLSFVGPRGRMVKSGAENIYVAEVEACIATHPDVQEVGIIGVPDEQWGQRVTAIVVADPAAGVTETAVVEHCRSRLASYKKPSTVVVRPEPLPRTGAGIDYDALDEQYGGGGYPGSEQFRRNARF